VRYRQLAAIGAIAAVTAFCWGFRTEPAAAWERHDLITRALLRNAPWLDNFRRLEVLPASGSDCAACDKDPYNPDYLPLFIDRLPGEPTTAREVLVRYVDEPDWGMDEAISVSPLQTLAGGSKGYRHQYYYYAAGLARVGDAPGRVKHFYRLALAAYSAGDPYWAFRHLARALHYLEDLGQPLHTQPFRLEWLRRTRLSIARTTMLASHLHYGYERLVTWHLGRDIRRDGGSLITALRKAPRLRFEDPDTAARALAEFSSNRAPALLGDLDAFFPKRVKSTRKLVIPSEAEIYPAGRSGAYTRILGSTTRSFEVTAGVVVSVLEMARRDFSKVDRARRQDD
jgi:hypothetical protein